MPLAARPVQTCVNICFTCMTKINLDKNVLSVIYSHCPDITYIISFFIPYRTMMEVTPYLKQVMASSLSIWKEDTIDVGKKVNEPQMGKGSIMRG